MSRKHTVCLAPRKLGNVPFPLFSSHTPPISSADRGCARFSYFENGMPEGLARASNYYVIASRLPNNFMRFLVPRAFRFQSQTRPLTTRWFRSNANVSKVKKNLGHDPPPNYAMVSIKYNVSKVKKSRVTVCSLTT